MTNKILKADCAANVVTLDGLPVTAAEILSDGIGSSTGILFIDKDKCYYLPSSVEDIRDLITSLEGIVTDLISITTALNGATVPPAVATGGIASLTAKAAQLTALKAVLR